MQVQSRETKQRRADVTSDEAVNAVEFLKNQHREVDALFEEIEAAGERAGKKKASLFAKIAEKLTLHAKLEEVIFYPAAKNVDDDLVLEAREEHDNVKAMIRKLQKTKPSDETFDAKICVLKELVKHHVHEEEHEMFPKCESALGDEKLLELGQKMRAKSERWEELH